MIKKVLTILLSLASIHAFSQKKFFDKNDILIYSSQFISGYFDGCESLKSRGTILAGWLPKDLVITQRS